MRGIADARLNGTPIEHPIRYGWLTTALPAICLFSLNFYVCRELWHKGWRAIANGRHAPILHGCSERSSGSVSASLPEWEYDFQRSLGASGRETPWRV
jgi:hypothetical protein